jgi:hypothetical protein
MVYSFLLAGNNVGWCTDRREIYSGRHCPVKKEGSNGALRVKEFLDHEYK